MLGKRSEISEFIYRTAGSKYSYVNIWILRQATLPQVTLVFRYHQTNADLVSKSRAATAPLSSSPP
jgi:hypothetical protein